MKKRLGRRRNGWRYRLATFFHTCMSWASSHKRQVWIGGGVLAAVVVFVVMLAVFLPKGESVEVGTTPALSANPAVSEAPNASATIEPTPATTPTGEKAEKQLLLGMIVGERGESVAQGFGVYAESLMQEGGLDQYLIYTAVDDENQQIQDVRSLLNQGCGAIVVAGVEDYTFEIICQLAQKAQVPVIAVEAQMETGYTVNITTGDQTQAYLTWLEQTLPAGSAVGVLAEKESSAFSQQAVEGIGRKLSLGGVAYESEEDYAKQRETLLKNGPDGLLLEGSLAKDAVYQAAKLGKMPRAVAGDATAGLIRQWYALKNGGIALPIEDKTSANPQASQGEDKVEPEESPVATPEPSTQFFTAPESQLYGGLTLPKEALGEAACRFAFQFAIGQEWTQEAPYTYVLQAKNGVTEENLAAYYKQAQDKEDDALLVGEADLEDIEKRFQ